MQKKIKVLKLLTAEETEVGVGAIILLPYATRQMVSFLRRKYQQDPTCIGGDIEFLFKFAGEGIRKDENLYRP